MAYNNQKCREIYKMRRPKLKLKTAEKGREIAKRIKRNKD